MSQKTRKTEIMKAMCANEKPISGTEDRLINLGQYQQYALAQTFGSFDAPRKTFGDLTNFYEKMNDSFQLSLEKEVVRLRNECRTIETEIQNVLGNLNDRALIKPQLVKYLKKDHLNWSEMIFGSFEPVLMEMRLRDGEVRKFFDAILITKGGVVFLEIRKPRRDSCIDKEGNYISFYYEEAKIRKYNLLQNLEKGVKLIGDILERHGLKGIPVYPVVIVEGDMHCANLCERIKAIYIHEIGMYLDKVCSECICDDSIQRQINQALEDAKDKETVITQYETGFIEAYADLRSKVEERIRKSKKEV